MSEPTIFDPVQWKFVGISALQTAILYGLVILGLKLVGRRVFAELGPHDLVVLLLISEATDIGLTPQEGGFWASFASVCTILLLGFIIERSPMLRRIVENKALTLVQNGQILAEQLRKNMVDESDLEAAAHKYGFSDISVFETMVLESSGTISGVLKPEYRHSVSTESEG